jgi:hypothetical protein
VPDEQLDRLIAQWLDVAKDLIAKPTEDAHDIAAKLNYARACCQRDRKCVEARSRYAGRHPTGHAVTSELIVAHDAAVTHGYAVHPFLPFTILKPLW